MEAQRRFDHLTKYFAGVVLRACPLAGRHHLTCRGCASEQSIWALGCGVRFLRKVLIRIVMLVVSARLASKPLHE